MKIRALLIMFVVLLNVAAGCDDVEETITGNEPRCTPSITIVVVTPEG